MATSTMWRRLNSNETGPDTDDATIPVAANPALNITKVVSLITELPDGGGALPPNDVPGEVNTPGATITYAIAVENTGNVALTGVTVSDPYANTLDEDTVAGGWNSGDLDQDDVLDTNETWNWTATHIVTEAEYLNEGVDGELENTATADSDQTGPDEATAVVPIDAAPHVDIIKQVDANGDGDFNKTEIVSGPGPVVVDYQYRVYQPAGGTSWHQSATTDPLSNIDIIDDRGTAGTGDDIAIMLDGVLQDNIAQANGDTFQMEITGDDGDGILQYGENWFIKLLDVEISPDANGKHTNKVYFTGEDDEGNPKEDLSDSTVKFASLSVDKVADKATVSAAGEIITYTIAVDNTGPVDLHNVVVNDPLLSNLTLFSGDDGDNILETNETWIYKGSYIVQQSDLDSNGGGDGDIDNTVTVDSTETSEATDSADVDLIRTPDISLDKEGTLDLGQDGKAGVGDVIHYTFAVTNTGNVTLDPVQIVDPKIASIVGADTDGNGFIDGDADSDGKLDVGETWTYIGDYLLTQADLDAGKVDNTATVTGYTPDDDDVSGTDNETVDIPFVGDPGIDLEKSVVGVCNKDGSKDSDGVPDLVGDKIAYKVVITNTGNVDLTNIVVKDLFDGKAPVILNNATVQGDTDSDGVLDVGEFMDLSLQADADQGRSQEA